MLVKHDLPTNQIYYHHLVTLVKLKCCVLRSASVSRVKYDTHTASGLCPHTNGTLSPNNGECWELLQIERKIHAEVGAEESSDGN